MQEALFGISLLVGAAFLLLVASAEAKTWGVEIVHRIAGLIRMANDRSERYVCAEWTARAAAQLAARREWALVYQESRAASEGGTQVVLRSFATRALAEQYYRDCAQRPPYGGGSVVRVTE